MGDLMDMDVDPVTSNESESEVNELAIPSDLWRKSPTPKEDFSETEGDQENGDWEVKVVGEEVTYEGKVVHEIEWKNWKRADGTNTTWDDDIVNEPHILRKWTKEQRARRKYLAEESTSINIWTTLDVHNIKTRLRQQAFEEKLRMEEAHPCNWRKELEASMRERVEMESTPSTNLRNTAARRQQSENSTSQLLVRRNKHTAASSSVTLSSARSTPSTIPSSINSSSSRPPPSSSVSSTTSIAIKRDSRFRSPSPPSFDILPSSVIHIKRTTTTSTPSSSIASISSRSRLKAQKLITENLPSSPEIPMISPHRTMLSPEIPVLSLPPPPLPPAAFSKRFTRSLPSKPFSSATASTRSTSSSSRSNASHVTNKSYVLIPPPIPSPRLLKPLPSRSASSVNAKGKAKETLRQALQRQWTTAARTVGAAPIYFVNEVDDEEVPPQLVDFCYMESKYRSEEVKLECEPYFFASCGCKDCKNAEICDCQAISELRDKKGKRTFAYDKEGLFKFIVNPGVEVVECNRFCKCNIETCPNRVAQRPRDIPIEVFKTGTCGWGVRPTINVKRGKVLGIYTGLLMTRHTANALADTTYCFALDGHEAPDEETVENAYSVDSRVCGNWTRFINHSCSPNLEVYMVLYETISEMNMPYLVFVATENIPARTEFTVDYDPAAPIAAVDKKGRFKVPKGARECKCLSKACRGYVRA